VYRGGKRRDEREEGAKEREGSSIDMYNNDVGQESAIKL